VFVQDIQPVIGPSLRALDARGGTPSHTIPARRDPWKSSQVSNDAE